MDGGRAMGRRLTRQDFLLLSAGAGAGLVLAGCGGGPQSNPAVQQGQSAGSGKSYNGPKVDLAFWNGFTGGDGPFMRQMVEEFSAQEKNINVTMNTVSGKPTIRRFRPRCLAGRAPT